MTDSGNKSSFWSSLPGISTALAGLIGAVAALLTALYTVGVIGPGSGNEPQAQSPAPAASVSSTAGGTAASSSGSGSRVGATAIDRTKAIPVARAALSAYRSRDVIALAGLVCAVNKRIFTELAAQGEAHPRYASIFSGWRWQGVQAWRDTAPMEARYRHYVSTARDEYQAHVRFGEIGPDELLTVVLSWQNAAWCFDDVNTRRPAFLRKEPPSSGWSRKPTRGDLFQAGS